MTTELTKHGPFPNCSTCGFPIDGGGFCKPGCAGGDAIMCPCSCDKCQPSRPSDPSGLTRYVTRGAQVVDFNGGHAKDIRGGTAINIAADVDAELARLRAAWDQAVDDCRAAQLERDSIRQAYITALDKSEAENQRPRERVEKSIDGRALASALKKVLPPDLLQEVIDRCDPLGAFIRALARPGERTQESDDATR